MRASSVTLGKPFHLAEPQLLTCKRARRTVRARWRVITGHICVVTCIILKLAFLLEVGTDFSRQLGWARPALRAKVVTIELEGYGYLSVGHTMVAGRPCSRPLLSVTSPGGGRHVRCASALCWWLVLFHFRFLQPLLLQHNSCPGRFCRVSRMPLALVY